MFKEKKVVGIFPAGANISPWHILFYDQIFVIGQSKSTSDGLLPLIESGIIRYVEPEVEVITSPLHFLLSCDSYSRNLFEELSGMQAIHDRRSRREVSGRIAMEYLPFIGNPPNENFIIAENSVEERLQNLRTQTSFLLERAKVEIKHRLLNQQKDLIDRLDNSESMFCSNLPRIIYSPTLEIDKNSKSELAYHNFVDGMGLKFTKIAVPKLPAEKFITFKNQHQDKLRRFRIAFQYAYSSTGQLEDCVEEMALALQDYNLEVESINKKYEYTTMSLSVTSFSKILTDASGLEIVKAIVDIGKGLVKAKEYKTMKEQELLKANGAEYAYIHELDQFFTNGDDVKE